MLDETTLEKRLVTLEQAVAELQNKIDRPPVESAPVDNWLEKLIGSISDEAAFLEALEYGRAYRQSDQPTDEDDESL